MSQCSLAVLKLLPGFYSVVIATVPTLHHRLLGWCLLGRSFYCPNTEECHAWKWPSAEDSSHSGAVLHNSQRSQPYCMPTSPYRANGTTRAVLPAGLHKVGPELYIRMTWGPSPPSLCSLVFPSPELWWVGLKWGRFEIASVVSLRISTVWE